MLYYCTFLVFISEFIHFKQIVLILAVVGELEQ